MIPRRSRVKFGYAENIPVPVMQDIAQDPNNENKGVNTLLPFVT